MRAFLYLYTLSVLAIPAFSQQLHTVVVHDSSGALFEEYQILGNDSSMVQGEYTRYYPNGQIEVRGHFKDGQKNGLFEE